MYLTLAVSGLYVFFVFCLLMGLFRLNKPTKKQSVHHIKACLIVPFRNESERIKPLLNSLLSIQYPIELLSILFVNDHSDDKGPDMVSQFIAKNRLKGKLIDLPDGFQGKKAALEYALIHADGEYVFFTDADCVLPPQWIHTMLNYACQNKCDMLGGAVAMTGKSFIGKFQVAEFLSLQAVTLGTSTYNKAVLSNAANMCVRTDVIKALDDPFRRDVTSGDDVFLMEKLQSESKKIAFSFNPNAVVKTPASESLKALLNQRARWLGKVRRYNLNFSVFVGGSFAFLQFAYLFVIVMLLVYNHWLVLLFFIVNKLVFDQVLLFQTASMLNIKSNVFYRIVLSLIYPVWTLFSSISAFIIRPEWKGRKVEV